MNVLTSVPDAVIGNLVVTGSLLTPTPVATKPRVGVIFVGQSNIPGAGDWGAASGVLAADPMERRWLPFAAARFSGKIALSPTDPPTFMTYGTGDVAPYDTPGNPNYGPVLAFARAANRFNLRNADGATPIGMFAVWGAGLAANFLPTANYPSVGPNLFTQFVTFCQAFIAEHAIDVAVVVFGAGETDAMVLANANAWGANMGAFDAALRAAIGNYYLVITRLSVNQAVGGDNAVPQVQAQQDAFAAAHAATCGIVNTDDLYAPGNFHFAPSAADTLGERQARVALAAVKPITVTQNGGPRFVGADVGQEWIKGGISPAYVSPRWWEFAQDDDIALLVTWGSSSNVGGALNTLAAAAGFTLIDSVQSNIGAADQAWLGVWWARKAGVMATPTVNLLNDYNTARMFVIRGALQNANPIDVTSKGAAGARGTAMALPGANTTAAGDLVVLIGAADVAGGQGDVTQTDWTVPELRGLQTHQQGCYRLTGALQNRQMLSIASGYMTAAGAFTGPTATLSQASKWAAMSIAIKHRA